LGFYIIAGLSLLITGSVSHRHAKQYAEITGYALISGAGFIIALGVIIIVLCALGFFGAYKNRLGLLQAFIGTLFIILLLQLIAAIVAFTLRNKAEDQLRGKLMSTMPLYTSGSNGEVKIEWDRLQQDWKCCGVDNPNDWQAYGNTSIPSSCCLNNNCGTSEHFSVGCLGYAKALFFRYSKALGGVSIFFFFVEVIGLVLAILLLRDLKNNYGSV